MFSSYVKSIRGTLLKKYLWSTKELMWTNEHKDYLRDMYRNSVAAAEVARSINNRRNNETNDSS